LPHDDLSRADISARLGALTWIALQNAA